MPDEPGVSAQQPPPPAGHAGQKPKQRAARESSKKRREERRARPDHQKPPRDPEREYQEAHQAAIAQGDLETIFGHNLPPNQGGMLKYGLLTYEREIRQTVQNALDQRGIMGLTEQIVGSHLKMLAEVIMRLRLFLASRDYGLSTQAPTVPLPSIASVHAPDEENLQLFELLDRATQSYMKVLRDYTSARHALLLGQGPQKGQQAEGAAAPSARRA